MELNRLKLDAAEVTNQVLADDRRWPPGLAANNCPGKGYNGTRSPCSLMIVRRQGRPFPVLLSETWTSSVASLKEFSNERLSRLISLTMMSSVCAGGSTERTLSPSRKNPAGTRSVWTSGSSMRNSVPSLWPFSWTGHSSFTSSCRMKSVASPSFFSAEK